MSKVEGADLSRRPLSWQRDLETDPDALIPVAWAIMLPPPILVVVDLSPLPIVAVDVDTVLWLVLIFLFRVPAIAFLVANDRCRCARR